MFAVFALEGQVTSRKTEHQQPVGSDEGGHSKFDPCWGVGTNADDRRIRVIGGSGDQACKVIVPTRQDGCEDGNDRESHQVAEVLYRFRGKKH